MFNGNYILSYLELAFQLVADFIMVDFTCMTCSVTLIEQEMVEHLVSTKHKNVRHDPSQTNLKCSKCKYSNVQHLHMVRLDVYNIEQILCLFCFNEVKMRTKSNDTLKKGELLKKVHDFYVRAEDPSCQLCETKNDLNASKNTKGLVVCQNCIDEQNLGDTETFVQSLAGDLSSLQLGTSKKHWGRIGQKKSPKPYYDSLFEYYRELQYYLFLEEQLTVDPIKDFL